MSPGEKDLSRAAVWLPVFSLLLIQMGSGLRDNPQFAFFLIYLQERFNLPPVTISSMVAGSQVAGMATALLGGAINARLGNKWVLVCGLALSGLSSLVFQTPALVVATILWILGGAGMALVTIGAASYLTQISARGAMGILAAFYALSMTIGGAVGNPLAAWLIERHGYGVFSWTAIAISLCLILVVLFLMPSLNKSVAKPTPINAFWHGVRSSIRQPKIRLLAGLRLLPTFFYGMLTVLIPLIINHLTGSKTTVAAFGTTSLIVASAAQLLAGRTADRFGARFPSLAAYSAIIFSGLGLAFSAASVLGVFVFGVIGIAAAWSLSTLMYVWVNDGIAKAEHAMTFGLLHAVWSISMISGSVFGSWFVSSLPGLPFLVAGLLNGASLFLITAYYNRKSPEYATPGKPVSQESAE